MIRHLDRLLANEGKEQIFVMSVVVHHTMAPEPERADRVYEIPTTDSASLKWSAKWRRAAERLG
jgi:hypothetical protein